MGSCSFLYYSSSHEAPPHSPDLSNWALGEIFWGFVLSREITCAPLEVSREREGMDAVDINTITSINTNIGEISINTMIEASVKNTVNNICTSCSFCCSENHNSRSGPGFGSSSNIGFSIGLPSSPTSAPSFGSNWPFHSEQ